MGCLQLPYVYNIGYHVHQSGADKLHPDLDLAELGYGSDDIVSVVTEPGDLVVWHQDMIQLITA